jgi:hypothetical protein
VLGIGERKTPGPFIAACDKFTYIEVIRANADEAIQAEQMFDEAASAADARAAKGAEKAASGGSGAQKPASDKSRSGRNGRGSKAVSKKVVKMIADSISDLAGEDGCVFMGELGNLIIKKQPDFDCRNFGYKNLSAMINSIGRFEVDFRQTSDPNITHPSVRDLET